MVRWVAPRVIACLGLVASCLGCGTPTPDGGADVGPQTGCPAAQHDCNGECASDNSVATCGASCTACPVPANGIATCDGIACGIQCDDSFHDCSGTCVSNFALDSCGTSCGPCPSPPANAITTCDGLSCGFSCGAAFHDCNGICAVNTSTNSCGTSCSPCAAPAHATTTCDGMACGWQCDLGYVPSGSSCVSSIDTPRPVEPLSTSIVTSRRPTLRWQLAPGTDGAHVELCVDRPCASVIETIDATGSSVRPTADLPAGVVFWRLRGRAGAITGTAFGPTWQLTVGVRSAPVDASWGTVLDVNGDGYADVAVGVPWALSEKGRVQIYHGSSAGITAPSSALDGIDFSGQFGFTVRSAGDVNGDGYADLLVAAAYWPSRSGAGARAGRGYVFLGGASGLATSPVATLVTPDGAGSLFGYSAASIGDANQDGYADIVIGAPGAASDAGKVYIFLGGADGTALTPSASFTGSDLLGNFGAAVASAGDFNGDGYEDLAVGAPSSSRAFAYRGGGSGFTSQPISLTEPGGSTAGFGSSIAAGDFNGDGRADLVVGEPLALSLIGRAHVYDGEIGGLPSSPTRTFEGRTESQFGNSAACAGDIDKDGYSDLVIGAPEMQSVVISDLPAGAVLSYLGAANGLTVGIEVSPPLPAGTNSSFGYSVTAAGDVNGDGYADVVVGAPNHAPGDVGKIFVHLGTSSGMGATANPELTGPDGAGGHFGWSVACE